MTELHNTVELRGTIYEGVAFSHQTYGEKFYRFTLKVKRESDVWDSIPVLISERVVGGLYLPEGQQAVLRGSLRTYHGGAEGSRLSLMVFATEIALPEGDEREYYNFAELSGSIGRTANYRTTPTGREIADFLISVPRPYGKTDHIPCILWGRNARYIAGFGVGKEITLRGRLQSRHYTKQLEGLPQDRTTYEVSGSTIEL